MFESEDLDRLQQMFSDLNMFAHKTSRRMDILYDHQDNLPALTMQVSEEVDVFPRNDRKGENLCTCSITQAHYSFSTVRRECSNSWAGQEIGSPDSPEFGAQVATTTEYSDSGLPGNP